MSDNLLKQGLSRRHFLRGAAVAGTVAASGGALGAFGKPLVARAQDVSWAREADVVVLGSGTGQLAALRAAANGLTAIVLEKAATGGGTTGLSGGVIWVPFNYHMQALGVPDSREDALEYLRHATFGQSTPELMEAYVGTANAMVEFTRSLGIEWVFNSSYHDYYPEFPGGKPEGRSLSPVSTIEGVNGGGALARMMQAAGEELGVEYVFSTAARRLILNEAGEVIGVQAEQEGAEYNVRAHRGVVMATGGFDHNPDMVTHFLRGPVYYSSAVRTNTGDGHLMGMALGANLRNMNESWGWQVIYNEEGGFSLPTGAWELGKPGTIVVNRRGQRFHNEAATYDAATRTMYTYDNGTHEYMNIPAFAIGDAGFRAHYTFGMPLADELPSWVIEADTLADLAAALGIDPAGLEATVARFNEFAAQGIDPDFHRGESAFDQLGNGDRQRTDVPHPNLAPLTQGPFVGTVIWPGALGTSGGLQINSRARVLNVWGEEIPRLYAVGNVSGSIFGAGYPGAGATVAAGMTMGFIAADDLATLESV